MNRPESTVSIFLTLRSIKQGTCDAAYLQTSTRSQQVPSRSGLFCRKRVTHSPTTLLFTIPRVVVSKIVILIRPVTSFEVQLILNLFILVVYSSQGRILSVKGDVKAFTLALWRSSSHLIFSSLLFFSSLLLLLKSLLDTNISIWKTLESQFIFSFKVFFG